MMSLETRKKIGDANRGKRASAETRQKMSVARKGYKPSEAVVSKIAAAHRGMKRTEEAKQKMRAAWARNRDVRLEKLKHAGAVGTAKRTLPTTERVARAKARGACKRMLRRILTMARIRKDVGYEKLLGYSFLVLRAHLEAQFRPGMSWETRDSFHIDHIEPVASFFRRGIFDPAVINALSNLQVLTPEENRAKSDKGTRVGIFTART